MHYSLQHQSPTQNDLVPSKNSWRHFLGVTSDGDSTSGNKYHPADHSALFDFVDIKISPSQAKLCF